ncbi:MAG: hypothetical protein NTX50_13135 [Candidatus Sumerlaeota bacterium]|nr:hypothetical protein [Candidatus Sumerlaeota bacterium]
MSVRTIISMLAAIAVMSLLATTSASAQGADATGTWKWSFGGGGGGGRTMETSITLKQDGEKLTGTYNGRGGATPIEEGSVKAGTVSFKVTRERNGQKSTTKYEGKLDGDSIKGSMEGPGRDGTPQKRDWEAKRVK